MKNIKKITAILIAMFILFTCCSCSSETKSSQSSQNVSGISDNSEFTVRFIDVGQADCILVSCDGENMMIDSGNAADGDLVADYVEDLGIKTLNLIVSTHAHEDHLGGFPDIIEEIDVEKTLVSPGGHDTSYSQKFYNSLKKHSIPYSDAEHGDTFNLGSAKVQVVGPITNNEDDLNNTSVVLRLTYRGKSFLFTGDASRSEEKDILEAGYNVKADVLKAGHHGSNSSSNYVFLREVMPEYVVISVGKDNSYNHPGDNAVSRFKDTGATVYRTDMSGSVICTVDENGEIKFTYEKTNTNSDKKSNITEDSDPFYYEEQTDFKIIGNKNTKVYHKDSCSTLPNEKNRQYFENEESAKKAGYKAHEKCVNQK